ncbi:hypothetical protein DUNSADRAFT_8800 [Dunaliella salina]|uniref:Peptidase M14 domain-containing protein n=1 Tax=Dunaliella salina TaxID=3046 RepID=A0ABQ7GIR4_DUNSA|nr:hypothetical protein DUNSADRAFT_8800 [Dunaliella salina]|eukprot:KAF5834507.1 hypothetical protein DUNSADRAFT_8800 [Dunaliella salina]
MDADVQRHMELFPEEYPQHIPSPVPPQPPPPQHQQQQQHASTAAAPGDTNAGSYSTSAAMSKQSMPGSLLPHLQPAGTPSTGAGGELSPSASVASSDQLTAGSEGPHAWGASDATSSAPEVAESEETYAQGGGVAGGGAEERVGGGWKGSVRTVRAMRQLPVPPPSAAAQMLDLRRLVQPAAYMHDLRRLVHPEAVINRRVYLNAPERQPSGRQSVADETKLAAETAAAAAGAEAAGVAAAAAAAGAESAAQVPLAHASTQGRPASPGGQQHEVAAAASLAAIPMAVDASTEALPAGTEGRQQQKTAAAPTPIAAHASTEAVLFSHTHVVLQHALTVWRPAVGHCCATRPHPQPTLPPFHFGPGQHPQLRAEDRVRRFRVHSGTLGQPDQPEQGPARTKGLCAAVSSPGRCAPLLHAGRRTQHSQHQLHRKRQFMQHSKARRAHSWGRGDRFYFAVMGVQPGVPYKFNLVNFRKKQSLFASGMQPLVCCCRHPSASSTNNCDKNNDNSTEFCNASNGPNSNSSTSTNSSSNPDGQSMVGKEERRGVHVFSGGNAEGFYGPDGPANSPNPSAFSYPQPHSEQQHPHLPRQAAGIAPPSTTNSPATAQRLCEGHTSSGNLSSRDASSASSPGFSAANGGLASSCNLASLAGRDGSAAHSATGRSAVSSSSSGLSAVGGGLASREGYASSAAGRSASLNPHLSLNLNPSGGLSGRSSHDALLPLSPPNVPQPTYHNPAWSSTTAAAAHHNSVWSSTSAAPAEKRYEGATAAGSDQHVWRGGAQGTTTAAAPLDHHVWRGGAHGCPPKLTPFMGGASDMLDSRAERGHPSSPGSRTSLVDLSTALPQGTPTKEGGRGLRGGALVCTSTFIVGGDRASATYGSRSGSCSLNALGGVRDGREGLTAGGQSLRDSGAGCVTSGFLDVAGATYPLGSRGSSKKGGSSGGASGLGLSVNALEPQPPPPRALHHPRPAPPTRSPCATPTPARYPEQQQLPQQQQQQQQQRLVPPQGVWGGQGQGLAGSAPGTWVRMGSHVAYYPSPYRGRPTAAPAFAEAPKRGLKKFPEADATYYVAPCYPYTYSDLQEHLDRLTARLSVPASPPSPILSPSPPPLEQHLHQQQAHRQQQGQQQQQFARPLEVSSIQLRPRSPSPYSAIPTSSSSSLERGSNPPVGGMLVRSLLCYTLAGHRVECLTITDFRAPLEVVRQREAIVLTARVHPGESNASWIMQGVLDFLTSDAPAAHTLRRSFVFKIVPMLNPDGVINGSYRCSLAGVDLNRMWEHPLKFQHPSVYHSKKLLAHLAGACRLALYVDIHGHSTKEDAFFYGCEPNLAGLDKTPPAPYPQPAPTASPPLSSPSRHNPLTTRPGGTAFEVDAPTPGGYITSGSDGLDRWTPSRQAATSPPAVVALIGVPYATFHAHVDAPTPGGYITSGSDGLDWGAPGSLAAMPMLAGSAVPQWSTPTLSVSGSAAQWQLHPQQALLQQQQQQQQHEGAAWAQQAQGPVLWPNFNCNLGGAPAGAAAAAAAAGGLQYPGSQQIGPAAAGAGAAAAAAAGLCQPPSARQAARLRVRMLPYLASCISSLGAARVVANRELGCAGAYTLEASLGGRALGRTHFSAADYISLGENLCRGVAALAEVDDAALLEDMARNVSLPPVSST